MQLEDILIFKGIDAHIPGETILIPNPATDMPCEPPQESIVVEGDTTKSSGLQDRICDHIGPIEKLYTIPDRTHQPDNPKECPAGVFGTFHTIS